MISGYPHKAGGMLEVACHSIEKRLCRPVQSNILSLGGFPAPRAEKYLRDKALNSSPDYLIIQFGSTDANSPIRRRSRTRSTSPNPSSSDPSAEFHHSQSATLLSLLRWEQIHSQDRSNNLHAAVCCSYNANGKSLQGCRGDPGCLIALRLRIPLRHEERNRLHERTPGSSKGSGHDSD
jgi:hypothetical protein